MKTDYGKVPKKDKKLTWIGKLLIFFSEGYKVIIFS